MFSGGNKLQPSVSWQATDKNENKYCCKINYLLIIYISVLLKIFKLVMFCVDSIWPVDSVKKQKLSKSQPIIN